MEFFSIVKKIFQKENIEISERLYTVEASLNVNYGNFPKDEDIIDIFKHVSDRDCLKINLECGFKSQIITQKTVDLSEFRDDLVDDDSVNVKIQIDKNVVGGRFSIYNFDSFSMDLNSRSVVDVMHWFSKILKNKNIVVFNIFDSDVMLKTKTMIFCSCTDSFSKIEFNRFDRLSECRNVASFYDMNTYELIPDDFMIEGVRRNSENLEELFNKISTILSLVYTSTFAHIESNDIFLKMNGHINLSEHFCVEQICYSKTWKKIYQWIYTDGNATDKALLVQNVIGLYCKQENLLSLEDDIFIGIKSNYNLYLKENIKLYLEMKRDISKNIQNNIFEIQKNLFTVFDAFKKNILAIFAFLFTVVVTKIGENVKFKDIFNAEISNIMEFVFVGSIIYAYIEFNETNEKIANIEKRFDNFKEIYKDIISTSGESENVNNNKMIRAEISEIDSKARKWIYFWISVMILAILIIEIFTDGGILKLLYKIICEKIYCVLSCILSTKNT